jgi:hypothetical protein
MTISERPNHELIQSGRVVVDLYLYFVLGPASDPDSSRNQRSDVHGQDLGIVGLSARKIRSLPLVRFFACHFFFVERRSPRFPRCQDCNSLVVTVFPISYDFFVSQSHIKTSLVPCIRC